ncbi:putative phosphoglucosamine mutase protein [Marine Group I thaumarchaeote SCGC AAA799-E16]|uniref:Putative phosphoglucosamine mutase protein n=4 Tax=Marine Group I TaxID=905826 RepID=A0A081RMJ8_9ARCH|nr:putative phosphoglucosamine mutase protein [Marine Group I thaumarchaeote SCGC AAA799-N04]KER05794.1 putative phosphoglucosamine mutase protein [Marine Group I thaumarchaeote SCGC AAA799-E16]KFM15400.1 putative phosphoglucosamine mutase protein [Marine Group I thaumarchaeote SCGC AAA799-D11]KFM16592.1 putative phosphoglucosamine mutase protein [Marine Group I thaumarchaeote SCGC RSA3]
MKKTISGIRGIFGQDLNLKDVLEFCNNFSSLVKSGKCAIGKDTRPSGSMIKDTASAALMKNGIDVFDLGTVPTPVVFREARKYGAGIVVSSSHNPIEWNGLKFIIEGRGINEKELPKIIQKQEIKSVKIGSEQEISSSYIEDARKIIGDLESQPQVAVDIGGGAAKGFVPELLESIGCKVQVLNENLQGCTRGPDPTADNLDDLVAASSNKEIGFAFDLDGDRLVVVRNGKKQTPDVTLGLGVAKSLELGYKNFVLSIDTSVSVEKFIKDNGGVVQRTKVGEANVIEQMINDNAQAGGEGSSGGFILPEFNYCREGILTSGLISSMLGTQKFNEVLNFMESYFQIRDKTSIDAQFHDKVIDDVHSKLSKEYSEVITLDGVKGIIDENSWVLIRKSNTEDIIRVSAESNDENKCKQIVKDTIELVNQSYEQVR